MGKKRQQARTEFAATADFLASEVMSGKWDHLIPHWNHIPVAGWDAALKEFALRCPGHSEEDYVLALRRSCWDNR